MKARKDKMSLKQKMVIVILLCFAIIYIICVIVKYRNSYDYLIKTPHYKETMEFINNYDYSKVDKIYVHTLSVCEFENQSLAVTKEEEPEVFEDILTLFCDESRKYGEHKIEHNHTPTYYVTFTDEETSEEITIYVYSAYNVILYEDCYFKCLEDMHSDFIIIKDAIMNAGKEKQKEVFEHFDYGVISTSLVAENIVWNEYPQFRKVEFTLNGRLEITVPHGYVLSPGELQNPDALKEISRKSKDLSAGSNEIRYDEVVYEFADARIRSNFPKIYGKPKQDATYSYQLSYPVEDGKVVVGYILPMDDEFKICTKEESMFWECTQNIDLDFMSLSKTYVDENILHTKAQNPMITVAKKESGVLDCSIKNEGDSVWQYSYVPVIEVWSQGVWLEIKSDYVDPGVLQGCEAKQACDITVPESALLGYPYLSPGLYRLVIYGDDGTYAATESFVMEETLLLPKTESTFVSDFDTFVVKKVLENYMDGDIITASDVAIDKVYYGSFSQENANEILVLCKILNMPHVGGLDKTIGMVLEQDTLDVVAYEEFPADRVEIDCFQMNNGKKRVLFIGTSTYQGISGQTILLFDIQGSEWVQVPIDALNSIEGEYFCVMGEDKLFVASAAEITSPSEIIMILNWDAQAGMFTGCGSYETVADLKNDVNQGFIFQMSDALDSNLELSVDDYYIMTVNEVGVRGIPSEEAEINRTLSYQMVNVNAVVYAENDEKWALIDFFNFDSADDNIGWVKVSELMEYTEENYSLLRYPVKVTENCVDLETGEKVERDWFAVDYCDGYPEVWREGGQSYKIASSSIMYPPFKKDNKKVSDFMKLRETEWVVAPVEE